MNRANLMFLRASWEFGVLGWGLSVYVFPYVQHYVYSGIPWFNKEPAFLISMWMCLFAVPELRKHTAGLFLFMCSSNHCHVLEPFPPLIALAYCLVPIQHIAIVQYSLYKHNSKLICKIETRPSKTFRALCRRFRASYWHSKIAGSAVKTERCKEQY